MDVLDLAPYEEVCRTTPQCEGHETDGPGALQLGWLKSREELHEVQFLESIGQKKKQRKNNNKKKPWVLKLYLCIFIQKCLSDFCWQHVSLPCTALEHDALIIG